MELKTSFEELEKAGDYAFRDVEVSEGRTQLHFLAVAPTGDHFCIPIRKMGEPTVLPCVWDWNGDREKPTLTPSIFISPPSGWHGWVTNGVMTTC